ncbi:zinc-binding dehydrogenase [Nitrospinota bacterium]
MRAVLMKDKGLLEVEEIPEPVPGPGEALIEVEHCGICGSDLMTLEGNRPMELPRVLGHEFVGTLRAIEGGGDSSFRPGDRVVCEPIMGCGNCRSCRNGNYNVCHKRIILGVETDGAFAQFVRVPLHNLLKVPDGTPVEEAAMAQPLAVAVHTFRRITFQAGCTAAVLGAGPIGALLALMAQASGGTTVVLTEPNPFRKTLMERMGFPVIDPTKEDPVPAALSALNEGDEGFDVVFDAAGAPNSLHQATHMVRVLGQVVVVASYREEPQVGIMKARRQEVDYITTRAHIFDDFRAAVNIIASRRMDIRSLITDEIGLDEMPEAFQTLSEGGPMMKVLCQP